MIVDSEAPFLYFNPLSPHGERLSYYLKFPQFFIISIHSPLTGRDLPATSFTTTSCVFQSTLPSRGETLHTQCAAAYTTISIHSPLTGRDTPCSRKLKAERAFQSTLPSRGETQSMSCPSPSVIYFNPLSPHGERHRFYY